MTGPRHPLKPFAAGNAQREHDKAGIVTRLPGGTRLSVPSAVTDPNNADYTPDELEFLKAVEWYRRTNRRPFPTCREYLAILAALGYRKQPPTE